MDLSWRRLTGALAWWAGGFAAMGLLDGRVDLANLAMVLVATSALAAVLLPAWATALAAAVAVLAFNWLFVEPRHTFTVALAQQGWLLLAMAVVNTLVAALVASQRRLAGRAQQHAAREAALRAFAEQLRDSDDPLAQAGALRGSLQDAAGVPVSLLLARRRAPVEGDPGASLLIGEVDPNQRAGLWHCLRQAQALGPGSERHAEQPDGYLPLRGGGGAALGAAVLEDLGLAGRDEPLRAHLQALCDQLGAALHRQLALGEAHAADERSKAQAVRNTMLAALSHDYRTPLATILGAASSLQEQGGKLAAEQRRELAARIADEARRLSRMTDNALQLARLDTHGVSLRCDWESAEEMFGAALNRARPDEARQRLRARLEPGLPLVWCDALLMAQLLDNLIDNALKYSADGAAVELLAKRCSMHVVIAVRDRGPGIAPASREPVFDLFRRGAQPMAGHAAVFDRPGSGVGLAVCRGIATAHGGELRLRARGHGGSSFECWLPLREAPVLAQA